MIAPAERAAGRRRHPVRRHRAARHGGDGRARGPRVRDGDRERLRAARRRRCSPCSTAGIDVHCLRDLTRGGLASALVEIAEAAGCTSRIEEAAIPVREDVRGACEILGLDPLYVANEGRFVAFVPEPQADRGAGRAARATRSARAPAVIGRVSETPAGLVTLRSRIGATRVVDRHLGRAVASHLLITGRLFRVLTAVLRHCRGAKECQAADVRDRSLHMNARGCAYKPWPNPCIG